MLKRLLSLPNRMSQGASAFLFGARGTGKTVLARQWLANEPASLAVDLLEQKTFLRYLKRPGLLRDEVAGLLQGLHRKKLSVLVDEVQRVPPLLNEIHSLLNDFPHRVRFLLTGSSARKLKRGGANLLAGRAQVLHLHPLTVWEHDPGLHRALTYGGLPGLVLSKTDPSPWLDAYVSTYLKEEIQQEALVRRLDSFVRFLDLAAQFHGEPINFTRLSREGIASVPTISEFFSILEDTLVAFRVAGWNRSLKRQLLQAPKFYFFDTGVLNALRGEIAVDMKESSFRFGRLFETRIILDAVALNDYFSAGYIFAYWRTNSGLEVDLILYRNHWTPPLAIEIKASEDPAENDLKGLTAFLKEYPKAQGFCLCRAPRKQVRGAKTIYPWKEGLEAIFGNPSERGHD